MGELKSWGWWPICVQTAPHTQLGRLVVLIMLKCVLNIASCAQSSTVDDRRSSSTNLHFAKLLLLASCHLLLLPLCAGCGGAPAYGSRPKHTNEIAHNLCCSRTFPC